MTAHAAGGARSSGPADAVERFLFDAIRRGDERQASAIYRSLLPVVQATLLRVLGGPGRDHRVLTQRSMEAIVVALSRHPRPWACRLEAWATASAARAALQALRARLQPRQSEESWGDAPVPQTSPNGLAGPAAPTSGRLRWLLSELPPREAEVVLLCDLLGLDVAEAAVVTNASVEHVRRLSSAGRERLTRQIAANRR